MRVGFPVIWSRIIMGYVSTSIPLFLGLRALPIRSLARLFRFAFGSRFNVSDLSAINSSSRAYFSVENPMYLPTVFNPAPTREVLDINDSSVISPQDPNYYTWYQDFEFGLGYQDSGVATGANLLTQLFMNLSWVDYFCLPMKIKCLAILRGRPFKELLHRSQDLIQVSRATRLSRT